MTAYAGVILVLVRRDDDPQLDVKLHILLIVDNLHVLRRCPGHCSRQDIEGQSLAAPHRPRQHADDDDELNHLLAYWFIDTIGSQVSVINGERKHIRGYGGEKEEEEEDGRMVRNATGGWGDDVEVVVVVVLVEVAAGGGGGSGDGGKTGRGERTRGRGSQRTSLKTLCSLFPAVFDFPSPGCGRLPFLPWSFSTCQLQSR
ncbi:hypothetical protein E2C01_021152 [Portunus trituberculatus]|uniref:Uncharacterized protein n=1 Tax=Portunus trituberculatus TaxID=210409 RepID=A0A5B7E2H0_PORTR|nr:hypothetical protein [Portunus trituberculatus]